jgi:predicted membrane protein
MPLFLFFLVVLAIIICLCSVYFLFIVALAEYKEIKWYKKEKPKKLKHAPKPSTTTKHIDT